MSSGIYVLTLELKREKRITVGKLGQIDFLAGYYCYAGSALNGLEARISRHLRKEKKLYWHIDYLLKDARIINIAYAEINRGSSQKGAARAECRIAKSLTAFLFSIKGFGSSDCLCPSHLFYSNNPEFLAKKITKAFDKNSLKIEMFPVKGF